MLMDANNFAFIETIDYIILNSDGDTNMKNAIAYLDAQSKQKGLTIYQIIYDLFQKNIFEERSIQWAKAISFDKP